MRLDFETFSISGPLRSDELDGGLCSIDSFRIIGLASASHFVPMICGENSGQHGKNSIWQLFFPFCVIPEEKL